jgi:hypothetical protein
MARLLTLALAATLAAAPAFAQGKSKGRGAKPPKQSSRSTTPIVPGTGVRNFGMWLDDASLLPQGKGWTTFGVGYWRSTFGHQWDLPSLDAGLSVHRRVQVGFSAPVSIARYTDGSSARGLGDLYFSTKVGLIDPDRPGQRYGVAVVPVVEVLSSGSVSSGERRLHWALPVTVERRFDAFRVYGSTGYFSRGAFFAAGALELPVSDRVVAMGALSHSRSLQEDQLSDVMGLSQNRLDLTGGAAFVLTPSIMAFGSAGRTISRTDANASSVALSGGLSFSFDANHR